MDPRKNLTTGSISTVFRASFCLTAVILLGSNLSTISSARGVRASLSQQKEAGQTTTATPEAELRTGTELTRQGRFSEAIPHLLAAKGADEYASKFNLALCYAATNQAKLTIPVLEELRAHGHETAEVWNLLAQAYIAEKQNEDALAAFSKAVALKPDNEKMYALISDACLDHQSYELGLKIVDVGLRNLPESARLHYQRGVLLTALDRFDIAKQDFDSASQLARGTEIGYLAAAQKDLIAWDTAGAIHEAREAITKGNGNYIILSILGEALIRSGVNPGDAGFAEAQSALEKSVAERPSYARSHISLGKLYLMSDRGDDAIAQLEQARTLDPQNPAAYSYLASAYRSKGDIPRAKEALATLARLNQEQVTSIRDSGTAAGEHRGAENGIRNQ